MIDKLISFSIKNKIIITLFIIALVIWGAYSVTQLPIDAVPDITNNQVQIITQAPSLGAQEVEQFVTAPIELSLSNIPHVIEKRSVSRSGISVITIVFTDKTDIYWARQQISEKLKEAENIIPKGFGEPSLAPITTGLGEIYHYVIHTKPGYEKTWSASDLRTLQDWVIKTQLSGTDGVAEISGWGGYVKQYEVALDNERLNALNITIPEVFEALEKNNENTGGSYIEQAHNAYFIRGIGQVKSLNDIEKITVKNISGVPVLIRDVAKVQFGNAIRYGAVTRNGDGEAVAGIVLMLKGENFSDVIKHVKERMSRIQKSLPEGIVIEPFIDRTELVGRAIGTVEKNLLEGGLIVVFILVLFLGNFRAGLIVASVIPLSMLFAISMMNLFGVSGNLMSLGAIDFGLIVDGAVIIVESVIHRIQNGNIHHPGITKLSEEQMDEEVRMSASRMMRSAAFGQIIILIVYLPILTLVGIEGKMFRPMAETVGFAIFGALLLSLTYVPMASAFFLNKSTGHQKRSVSDRVIAFLHYIYEPALKLVLRFKRTTILISAILLICTIWLFSRMGGEFIPTLEEGDLTVEISMMQGTSLSEVISTFTKAEKLLKKDFPEIKQIVTRIGSAEIPTDPMPIERADMMLQMLPKETWKNALTREEMQDKIKNALTEIPGLRVEVTQPMQMRFNELMTGIRQDVAIKVFGDNLEILTVQAEKIAGLISDIKGVSEPTVEKISGLPQITVEYDRDKMAQYGLNISDVNLILKTAFAGNVAGVVFEGEKRFDLVVRLQKELREDQSNIENLYIPLPSGGKIPLVQVAKIEKKDAPAQVSREDGKRRIYVGFNVTDRDVQSTVDEIKTVLDNKLKLPAGYYLTYGGQFQNLMAAKKRLSIALPLALLLILVLLYLTFHSIRQSLLIFTAVPLSAIGGVAALLLRGMPFSISAGIGFIALFGVAVLNGIVLIGYFNQLEKDGLEDITERVKRGTYDRLRPVLMTAAVASLGFLPMALSTSAGAEVQKPLATVVIGGLISSTLLTLLVLPVLYVFFNKKHKPRKQMNISSKKFSAILLLMVCSFTAIQAQNPKPMTLDSSIKTALSNNVQLKISNLESQRSKLLENSAFDISKTDFTLSQDPTSGGNIDNSWGIHQTIAFPGVYLSQAKANKEQTLLKEKSAFIVRNRLVAEVKSAYYDLVYEQEKLRNLSYLDSLYKDFADKAEVRYRTGDASNLAKLSALSKQKEIALEKLQAETDVVIKKKELQRLLNTSREIIIADIKLVKIDNTNLSDSILSNALTDYYAQNIKYNNAQVNVEKNKLMPDFSLAYYHQYVIQGFNPAGINREYFHDTRIGGIQFGIMIPVFFQAQLSRINAAKISADIAKSELVNSQKYIEIQYSELYSQFAQLKHSVAYYESDGLSLAGQQIRVAGLSFEKGEIGYIEYIQNISQASDIKLRYIEVLRDYNQAIINLNQLTGK